MAAGRQHCLLQFIGQFNFQRCDTTPQSDRADPALHRSDHGVVRGSNNRPVVVQECVRYPGQAPFRLGIVRDDRLSTNSPGSRDNRPAEAREQFVVQRAVGKEGAEFAQSRRDCCKSEPCSRIFCSRTRLALTNSGQDDRAGRIDQCTGRWFIQVEAFSCDVKAVFTEVGTPQSVAQAVASDSGAELVELSTSQLPEDGTYQDLIRDIATTIAGALGDEAASS